jgi:hypothetical protein
MTDDDECARQIEAMPTRPSSAVPTNIDTFLTATQLSAALGELGFRVSRATLDTWVSRPGPNGGPPWRKWGVSRVRLYCWREARDWAESHLTPPVRTAAELRCPSPNSSA